MTVPATMLGGSAAARPGARTAARATPRASQSQGSALVRDRWRMSTEALALECAGVGFERDLAARLQRQPRTDVADQAVDGLG